MTTSSNTLLKSHQTKSRIMEAYIQLMNNKYWDKISVKEICSHCHITRGTFYQYFSDIYDLLEQIETPLLEELNKKFKLHDKSSSSHIPPEYFEKKFDISPPKSLAFWFEFCKKHKTVMRALLSNYGDPYFIIKLKNLLNKQIEQMMDEDLMPHDSLRSHFSKAFLELHLLVVRTWLDSDTENFLSTSEIINILNTMRVGANYLSYLNNKPLKD